MTEATMKAIVIDGGKGEASALHVADVPAPEPGDGQILIAVDAAGINRPDILQRRGFYPPPPGASPILGLEVCGRVAQGSGRWSEGDRVCALLPGGGYAQYAVADARHALPIPVGLSPVEAACLPETVFTVFANVFEHGRLKVGETLLVHGATSGIGVMAIAMAKAAGARVIATARGAEKAQRALALGADVGVDTQHQDFARIAQDFGGADVILDMVGASYFDADLEALKTGGRLVWIAAQGGGAVELQIARLMQKRLVLTGSTLRPRPAEEKARLASEVEKIVWPWIEAGAVRPIVDRVFPLEEASAAHAHLESGGHVGKVALTVNLGGA